MINIKELSENYHRSFPEYPPLHINGNWIYGVWFLGNNYKGSGYYGSYPPTYLKRIRSIFTKDQYPNEKVLQLFSGSLNKEDFGIKFDIKNVNNLTENFVQGDVHKLSEYFTPVCFDLILCDPPYSIEDAEHYGSSMIKRNTVLKECHKVISKGGVLVWLDQVLPQFSKKNWNLFGSIGIVRSTNHRVRFVFFFERI